MRAALRVVLLAIIVVTVGLCISAHGRSSLSPAGEETEITIGAIGPWFEYERTPQQSHFQFNVFSWSMFFGLIAAGCSWVYSRLSSPAQSPIDSPDTTTPTLDVNAQHA
jgi:hypothetical protein